MKKRQRAAALVFTLLMTAVMATLMAAFLVINRQQIALTGNTQARQAAYDACLSALHYVESCIEADQTWAAVSFSTNVTAVGYPGSAPLLTVQTHGDGQPGPNRPDVTRNYLEGQLDTPGGLKATFTARSVNNLQQDDPYVSPLGPVPGRAVRVRIDASSHGLSRRLDVVLRRRAFTNDLMKTGHDVVIDANGGNGLGWTMKSRDSISMVHANGSITAPKPSDQELRALNTRGDLRAVGEVTLKGSGSPLEVSKAQPSAVQTEETVGNVHFRPGDKDSPIPDLTADNMRFPDAVVHIPSGVYEMHDLVEEDGGVQVNEDPPAWNVTVKVHKSLITPGNIIAGPGSSVVVTRGAPGRGGWLGQQPTVDSPDGMYTLWNTTLEDGTVKNVRVDLDTGNIYVPPGVTLQTDGDLELRGSNNSAVNASLLFGMEPGGFAGFGMNPFALVDSMETKGAALTSANGSIKIGGMAMGLGSIDAHGDITFSAQPALSAVPTAAVAVRAGGNLNLKPPPSGKQFIGLPCDGPIFYSAMNATAAGNWGIFDGMSLADEDQMNHFTDGVMNKPVKTMAGEPLTAQSAWTLMAGPLGKSPTGYSNSTVVQDMANANFPRHPMDLQDYVALRRYMQTGDVATLNRSEESSVNATRSLISNQMFAYNNFAHSTMTKLEDLMKAGAVVPDMFFVGLVYAGGQVEIDGKGDNSLYTEGAVVSKGNVVVKGVPAAITVYNRRLLEDILAKTGTQTRVEPVFFNLQ